MNSFFDLIEGLRSIENDSAFLARAGDMLCQDADWGGLLASFLRGSNADDLAALVIEGFVANVSPRPFLIWSTDTTSFQVVLNYFDPEEASRLLAQGFLKAHNHHRPFVSRVLSGSYLNFLYSNAGTRDQPQLTLDRTDRIVAGNICEMPPDVFHSAISPEDGTLTIVVRGPPAFRKSHLPDCRYRVASALADRDRVLAILDRLSPQGNGKRVPYANLPPKR